MTVICGCQSSGLVDFMDLTHLSQSCKRREYWSLTDFYNQWIWQQPLWQITIYIYIYTRFSQKPRWNLESQIFPDFPGWITGFLVTKNYHSIFRWPKGLKQRARWVTCYVLVGPSFPLVMTVTLCELEHGPVEIVDFPSYNMVMFHRFLYVYQRVPALGQNHFHRNKWMA